MSLEEEIRASRIKVLPGRYAVVKSQNVQSLELHFMVSIDESETTVITEESNIDNLTILSIEKWYKLIQINVAGPFQTVGFLATISKNIAEANLNILIVSTFSRDYILLKEESAVKGLEVLASAGFPIEV